MENEIGLGTNLQSDNRKKLFVILGSIGAVLLLVLGLGAFVFVSRQNTVSPLPESGNETRVIFVSPNPSPSLMVSPSASSSASPKSSAKATPKTTPKVTPKATPKASSSPSNSPSSTP